MKMNGEKGQALPMVMIAVILGALVIPAFLSNTGTSLISSRVYANEMQAQYACDSGAEHAIWKLTNGGVADSLSEPGDMLNYSLPQSVNGLTPDVDICNSWLPLATDNFESVTWTGGIGWVDNWTHSGGAAIVTSNPFDGTHNLALENSSGLARRPVDLTGEVDVHLLFWAKVSGFESSDTAICEISSDGNTWITKETWTAASNQDNYYLYDIDLKSYEMTGRFWIGFSTAIGNNDHFYVDKVQVVWMAAPPVTVASDDFESGGWTGGTGWYDIWAHHGSAAIAGNPGKPYEGNNQLIFNNSAGNATRSVNLAENHVVHVRFWAMIDGFDPGDTGSFRVSSNNITWTTLRTFTNADNGAYNYYEFDISGYDITGRFWIGFWASVNNNNDYFYIDKLEVISLNAYGIRAGAGGRTIKAAVDIGSGVVDVLYWYFT
jgi:hypothetical protein